MSGDEAPGVAEDAVREPAEDAPPPDDAGGDGALAELNAKYLRALADYDNLKRRSHEDVQRRVDAATSAIFTDMINLADDFERALADEAGAEQPTESWREGVVLIQQKLLASLERHGVSPIAAAGVPFDPNYHEALGYAPGPKDEIVAELRRGYLSGGRVFRASQVMLGQGGPEADAESAPEPTAAEDAADEQEEDTAWDE